PGREQSLPRKRRTPSSDGASITRQLLLAKAAAPPCNGPPTRKGQASPPPRAIPATSTRISVRRGSTTWSSSRQSNDHNRDQRIFPLVWSRVAFGPAFA